MIEPIERAVEAAGGVMKLARTLGVSRETVRNWRAGTYRVSPEHAQAIERELSVPRHELRPDLWAEQ